MNQGDATPEFDRGLQRGRVSETCRSGGTASGRNRQLMSREATTAIPSIAAIGGVIATGSKGSAVAVVTFDPVYGLECPSLLLRALESTSAAVSPGRSVAFVLVREYDGLS